MERKIRVLIGKKPEIRHKDFEEELNEAIKEGWKPLWETFRFQIVGDVNDSDKYFSILLVKETDEVGKNEEND